MTTRKRKSLVLLLRVLSVAVMIGLPAVVVAYKFPLWRSQGGGAEAIGAGGIILLLIVFFTFKKYISAWAAEKLGAISAGASLIMLWSGLAIVCIVIASISTILEDLATVFIFAAIGAALGFGLLAIAKRLNKKEDGTDADVERSDQ